MSINVPPKVSILMGAYNAEATVGESIDSILAQSFDDWEFIVCDDGSTDNTLAIVQSYADRDSRIRVVVNPVNRGLTFSLNLALSLARGQYLARQDADDRSLPRRLEEQVAFLDSQPETAVVGSAMELFDAAGRWGRVAYPSVPTPRDFLRGSPFSHGASMSRAEVLREVQGYRDLKHTKRVEDYDLWFRIYECGHRGGNIQHELYAMRDDRDAYGRRRYRYRINEAVIRAEGARRLGMAWPNLLWAFQPLLVGLIPGSLYMRIRRRRRASDAGK